MPTKRTVNTIYVSIHDMVGNQLANNAGNMDISVVSFRYRYDDENDDVCTIKLQMSNPKSLNILNIRRGSKLQVIYGYLDGKLSPINTVVVRDMVSKYGNNIIYTELECTDYLRYLKISRSPDVAKGSIISYIQSQIYGRYSFIVKDRGKIVYTQPRKDKEAELEKNRILENKRFENSLIYDPIEEEIDNTVNSIGWSVDKGHGVRDYLEDDNKDIPTSNRSTYMVLMDLFKKCPNGPWFITGRGDQLLIHNRNLGKSVYRELIYQEEPGDLIDFQAKTKFDNFDKQLISYTGMDPKERKNFFIDDYREALFNQRSPKEILQDKEITKEEKKEELKKYVELRLTSYAKFGVVRSEGYFAKSYNSEDYLFVPGHLNSPIQKKLIAQEVAVPDNTNTVNPDPYIRDDTKKFDSDHEIMLRAYWYTIPLLTYEEAVNVTNNRQRELAMEKEEASVILIGDPWLTSEKTIRVSNVYSQHEGHYYIKQCEHVLMGEGFKTKLECIKVIPEAMIKTLGRITKDEYDKADDITKELIDTQYKREQMLFGSDISIRYKPRNAEDYKYVMGYGTKYKEYQEKLVKFSDIFTKQDYTEDNWISDMVDAYNNTILENSLNSKAEDR